ncbi:VanZ family protein [Pullulanibacillus sp. KACC 23026]|uniref:VanZ family protein n=1 Tax=Pullulanibacillus sp. KACC 23026 TaxID=3028315 RepID=UPI0023B13CDF|nr:VanZ family protein [Pullulanibacillus sp. KACC 23026]WEG14481.1 VanZ family protein [Pullulanibacillus sp. KACC 23026]
MSAIEFYLKELLNGVDMDKATKQDLYDEFYNHLTLAKLNYMKEGMFEEDAEKKCIKEFGDSKTIGKQLQKDMFPKKYFARMVSWGLFIPYIMTILFKLFIGCIIYNVPTKNFTTQRYQNYHWMFSHDTPTYNLIPFKTILNSNLANFWWGNYHFATFKFLFGNIAFFIPLSIFLLALFPFFRKKRNLFVFVTVLLVGIEFIQLFTSTGMVNIDNVILRMIGVTLGVFLYEKTRIVQISFGKKIKDFV